MMPHKEILATILSHEIRNEHVPCIREIDVQSLMSEASAHDVSALVYHGIKSQVDVSAYKKEVILKSLTQSRYTKEALILIDELQSIGIEVVLLKGIILKQSYPIPDFRTMGDVDILVKEHHLEAVDQYLRQKGYEKTPELNEQHYTYEGTGFQIEVHWNLASPKHQQSLEAFQENVWLHLQPYEINQKVYLTLSDEDFLIHLLLHKANHMHSSGFGIRQLCDVTLWIEQHSSLDWDYICGWLKRLCLMVFSQQLLLICQRLLALKIPDEMKTEMINEKKVNQFIDCIFSNGVHGKRDAQVQFVRGVAKDQQNKSFLQTVISLLFPCTEKIPTRYKYAHRYPILLPIAWIHRLGRMVIHSDYQVADKVKIILFSPKLAREQASLLTWLELTD